MHAISLDANRVARSYLRFEEQRRAARAPPGRL
jgi:hypothetical protein